MWLLDLKIFHLPAISKHMLFNCIDYVVQQTRSSQAKAHCLIMALFCQQLTRPDMNYVEPDLLQYSDTQGIKRYEVNNCPLFIL